MPQKYSVDIPVDMRVIKFTNDIYHLSPSLHLLFLAERVVMFFSKSFGYALRGMLYVALMQDEQPRVQIEEIAKKLSVPKHFLGKIMQHLVKKGFLKSTKGPYGGFSITQETLQLPLLRLVELTDGMDQFRECVLGLRECTDKSPCPLHHDLSRIRGDLLEVFSNTTIGDLLHDNKSSFIKSLSTY